MMGLSPCNPNLKDGREDRSGNRVGTDADTVLGDPDRKSADRWGSGDRGNTGNIFPGRSGSKPTGWPRSIPGQEASQIGGVMAWEDCHQGGGPKTAS
jgi:hypothetical protein